MPASCIAIPGTTGIRVLSYVSWSPMSPPHFFSSFLKVLSTFIDGVHNQGVFSSSFLFNLPPSFQIEALYTEKCSCHILRYLHFCQQYANAYHYLSMPSLAFQVSGQTAWLHSQRNIIFYNSCWTIQAHGLLTDFRNCPQATLLRIQQKESHHHLRLRQYFWWLYTQRRLLPLPLYLSNKSAILRAE